MSCCNEISSDNYEEWTVFFGYLGEKVQNGLLHAAANGGCLIFLLMTHIWKWVCIKHQPRKVCKCLKAGAEFTMIWNLEGDLKPAVQFRKDKCKKPDAWGKASAVQTRDKQEHRIDGMNHSTSHLCQTPMGAGGGLVWISRAGLSHQAGVLFTLHSGKAKVLLPDDILMDT